MQWNDNRCLRQIRVGFVLADVASNIRNVSVQADHARDERVVAVNVVCIFDSFLNVCGKILRQHDRISVLAGVHKSKNLLKRVEK